MIKKKFNFKEIKKSFSIKGFVVLKKGQIKFF